MFFLKKGKYLNKYCIKLSYDLKYKHELSHNKYCNKKEVCLCMSQ